MILTPAQLALIQQIVAADLATRDQAFAAFYRNDTGQIATWKAKLRLDRSEATAHYDRLGIAQKREYHA